MVLKKANYFLILSIILFFLTLMILFIIYLNITDNLLDDDKTKENYSKNQQNISNDFDKNITDEYIPDELNQENDLINRENQENQQLETDEETKPLPDDLEQKPCGYYFVEYNVCTGTCPSGECSLIGNSCYCIG